MNIEKLADELGGRYDMDAHYVQTILLEGVDDAGHSGVPSRIFESDALLAAQLTGEGERELRDYMREVFT